MTNREETLIDQYESFPRGAQELSAARLAQSVQRALDGCLAASGKSAREIAKLLGVTEGAVSQVLNAEGNVRIATLGRYLRAMGYEARIEVTPVDSAARPIAQPRRRQRRDSSSRTVAREKSVTVSVARCNVTDGNVVAQALLLVLPHDASGSPTSESDGGARQEPSAWHILDAGIPSSAARQGWQMSSSRSQTWANRHVAGHGQESDKSEGVGMSQ